MHKKLSWYYCTFPNGGTEGIIGIPKDLVEDSNSLCCTLYEVDGKLGEAMIEAVALATNIFEEDDVRKEHKIEDRVLYRHLEQNVYGFNPLRSFLKEWFLAVRKEPENINSADVTTEIINEFIEQCVEENSPCTMRMFQRFACKYCRSIKGAEIVQVSLDDCISKAWADESTDKILNIILTLYRIPNKEQEAIRDQFSLYMDNPAVFCSELKNWVNNSVFRNEQVDDLVVKYHFYKINSLYDLFSATMQEIALAKRSIKYCAHCERLFVTSKSDEIFCSRKCNVGEQTVRKERAERVKRCKERHKGDYDYMWKKLYEMDGREMTAILIESWNEHLEDVLKGRCSEEQFAKWVDEQKDWVDSCV